jgi:hypothetical protein
MKKTFASLLIISFLLSSCSHRLVGVWTVESYETVTNNNNSVKVSNIGTMSFRRNGNGEKNISYNVMGLPAKIDNLPFTWTANRRFVTLEGRGSDFAKSWIIMNNRMRYQIWKTTDGGNVVTVLTLRKGTKPVNSENNNNTNNRRWTNTRR